MSSPRAATKAVRKPVKSLTAARKAKVETGDASSLALRLAAEIEQSVMSGQPAVSHEAQQKLLAALCRSYSQQIQAGDQSPAITAAGGRILARGLPAQIYEAGLQQRTVVIEFDSVEQARAAHDSPAYQAALVVLAGAAERDLRILEGV